MADNQIAAGHHADTDQRILAFGFHVIVRNLGDSYVQVSRANGRWLLPPKGGSQSGVITNQVQPILVSGSSDSCVITYAFRQPLAEWLKEHSTDEFDAEPIIVEDLHDNGVRDVWRVTIKGSPVVEDSEGWQLKPTDPVDDRLPMNAVIAYRDREYFHSKKSGRRI